MDLDSAIESALERLETGPSRSERLARLAGIRPDWILKRDGPENYLAVVVSEEIGWAWLKILAANVAQAAHLAGLSFKGGPHGEAFFAGRVPMEVWSIPLGASPRGEGNVWHWLGQFRRGHRKHQWPVRLPAEEGKT